MGYIEEAIIVNAPADLIWGIWSEKYLGAGLKIGEQKHVVCDKNKGIKFKILSFKKNESLTIVWYSFLVNLVFHHNVQPKDIGSLVTCRVTLKGFFSFIIKPMIAGKIRKYLKQSLQQFSRDLNGI